MTKFRKKPVVIEAFQMTKAARVDNRDWPNWLNQAWNMEWPEVGCVSCEDFPQSSGHDRLVISTLEGEMTVGWDDWIIRGVKGELYACKPDIFAATYDDAEAPQSEVLTGDADLAHPERLKALSDAADYVEKIGARYHSGRDIANGIRCLGPRSPTIAQGVVDCGIRWQRVNLEPFEYAIQQGQHGAEFVKLLDGSCLRRASPVPSAHQNTPEK